ncbi:MAG: MBL fold metallo-hydrolase, partial [Parachlamydiaceae bacterium]
CLASLETAEELKQRYFFMFERKAHEKNRPRLELVSLEGDKGESEFLGLKFKYFSYTQLGMKVNGFRFGNLAYVTDIEKVDDHLIKEVEGVDILIVSALRHTHSIMHLTVDQAVDFARKTGAKQTYLTHLSHDLDYYKTNAILPSEVRLAYDSLEIPFSAY